MSKNTIIMIILLTAVWVILRETITLVTIAVGLVLSTFCVLVSRRMIPIAKTGSIKPLRLIVYLFFLLVQVYLGGLAVIKVILFGAHVEIVEIKTKISNNLLRSILVNSITLVPGSVSLDLNEDAITVLWLTRRTDAPPDVGLADEQLKGKLERMLIKAQK